MSDFKAKVHLIRFPLGDSAPDPAGVWGGVPQHSPRLPTCNFKGATSKEMEGKEKERGREREGESRGRKGRRGLAPVGESGSASG